MRKKILKISVVFMVGMVGGIFANQIFWPYLIEKPLFLKYRLEQKPVYLTEKKEVFIQENTALQNAIEQVEKTVIGIRAETSKGEILEGSGLVVASDGLIVTLAELVPFGSKFSFFVEGEPQKYEILKRDLENNLALVKIGKNNLNTVSFGDMSKIRKGQRVFLVGTLFNEKTEKVVGEGIISFFDEETIFTNIFENRLLKGSPLFDIEGKALGLSKIGDNGNVFAVPISVIQSFISL